MPEDTVYRTREPSGRHVLRRAADIVALGQPYYSRTLRRWMTGDPSAADSGALAYGGASGRRIPWRGSIAIPPPPPPVINWQSIPTYNLGSGDYYLPDGHYIKEEYDVPALSGGYDTTGRLYVGRSVIKSAGALIGHFREKATFNGTLYIAIPPTGANQRVPRAVNMQQLIDAEFKNVTFIGGRGMYFSGKDGQFYGDAAAGQGLRVLRTVYRNLDGRRSDGQGGKIKSNWGETHQGNSSRQSIGGVVGWDVANFVQCHEMPRMRLLIEWCESLIELGKGRCEDAVNMHGGSGGGPSWQAYIRDCLFDVLGGDDWTYQPGVSTSYNPSNQVTTGATSPQDTSQTESSATAVLLADAYRSVYADNASYTTAQRVIGIGSRPFISMQGGHHLTVDDCTIHNAGRHWSGVPFSWHQGYYQFSKYGNPNNTWGYQTFINSRTHSGTTSSVMGAPGDILFNNGTASNNRNEPAVPDQQGVITAFRARAQAAGVTLGSTLQVPA